MKLGPKSTCPVGVLVLLLFLTGCLGMGRNSVEKRTFVLNAGRQGEVGSSATGAILRVRKFRVSPRYEGKGFVYRTGDLRFESDFYREFFTPPASLITEEVRKWLAESGPFEVVMDLSGQTGPMYILEGEIIDLYGDYNRGSLPRAVMDIRFFLINDVSGRSEMVFQKRYRKEPPLKSDSPDALVQGWNEALSQILTDLERDLRQVVLKTGDETRADFLRKLQK
jgi:cholesterol transport system auxiliary component